MLCLPPHVIAQICWQWISRTLCPRVPPISSGFPFSYAIIARPVGVLAFTLGTVCTLWSHWSEFISLSISTYSPGSCCDAGTRSWQMPLSLSRPTWLFWYSAPLFLSVLVVLHLLLTCSLRVWFLWRLLPHVVSGRFSLSYLAFWLETYNYIFVLMWVELY